MCCGRFVLDTAWLGKKIITIFSFFNAWFQVWKLIYFHCVCTPMSRKNIIRIMLKERDLISCKNKKSERHMKGERSKVFHFELLNVIVEGNKGFECKRWLWNVATVLRTLLFVLGRRIYYIVLCIKHSSWKSNREKFHSLNQRVRSPGNSNIIYAWTNTTKNNNYLNFLLTYLMWNT